MEKLKTNSYRCTLHIEDPVAGKNYCQIGFSVEGDVDDTFALANALREIADVVESPIEVDNDFFNEMIKETMLL